MEIIPGIDEGIIRLLSENGRASNKSIAQALELTETMVATRIRALTSNNVIQIVLQKNVHASSSTSVSALVEFYLGDAAKKGEVCDIIADIDAVFSAYETARRPEIIVNCRASSPRELNDVIKKMAETVPHVAQMNTLPILELGKFSTTLGALGLRRDVTVGSDDIGTRLVQLLQKDGRQSISSLARQLGLSITATRSRVENLLRQPGTTIGLICDSAALGYRTWFDIRATIAPSSLAAALERFSNHSAVRVIAHLAGQANLAIFLLTKSIQEVDRFIDDEVRRLPGLVDFTMMRVTRVFKYDYSYNL